MVPFSFHNSGASTKPRALHHPRKAELRATAKQHTGKKIRLTTDAMVHIPKDDLPGNVITALKHVASIANPEFFRRQTFRISTFGVPRYVTCFEDEDGELRIPRGLEDEARQILEDAGFTVTISRPRKKRPRIDVAFKGTLRPEQKKSVTRLSQHRTGVLVAPPGTGKTVIACALIARRKVPTAIIVNRTELLEQWRNRLQEFLTTQETGTDGPSIQAIYGELAADPARNALIVSKVTEAVNSGSHCLVLTNRLDHLDRLSEKIGEGTNAPVVSLHGRLAPPVRRTIRQQLSRLVESGDPFVLVAMDKVAGEGLDLPTLDTVFLAMPISFKGRIIQQLGRITRTTNSTTPATAHDFADLNVPVLRNMHTRRTRVARKEGFTPVRD